MSKPISIRLFLWIYNKLLPADISKITPAKFRHTTRKLVLRPNPFLDGGPIKMHKVINQSIDGEHGPIPIRSYRSTGDDGLPVILYFHGGGFVINDLDTHDKLCRRLARDNQALVISVDYRLAPEHPFPAAPQDCYDVTVWASQHADTLGGDPSCLNTMGDSAGGNLATVICLMARDKGGPKITSQVLIYPVTDALMSFPSIKTNGTGHILTEDLMRWFIGHYKRTDVDLQHPYMSPHYAESLSDLPSALVQTAEYDPLHDEGMAYAKRMQAEGVSVTHTNYPGLVHTYFNMPRLAKGCMASHKEVAVFLHGQWNKK